MGYMMGYIGYTLLDIFGKIMGYTAPLDILSKNLGMYYVKLWDILGKNYGIYLQKLWDILA